MLLNELMGLGDENIIGRLMDNASKTLKQLQTQSNKEINLLAKNILDIITQLEGNPNIVLVDNYTLIRFLQMLDKPKVDIKTLRIVSDALGSYNDNSTD